MNTKDNCLMWSGHNHLTLNSKNQWLIVPSCLKCDYTKHFLIKELFWYRWIGASLFSCFRKNFFLCLLIISWCTVSWSGKTDAIEDELMEIITIFSQTHICFAPFIYLDQVEVKWVHGGYWYLRDINIHRWMKKGEFDSDSFNQPLNNDDNEKRTFLWRYNSLY